MTPGIQPSFQSAPRALGEYRLFYGSEDLVVNERVVPIEPDRVRRTLSNENYYGVVVGWTDIGSGPVVQVRVNPAYLHGEFTPETLEPVSKPKSFWDHIEEDP